ncbi:MAG: hypothetical protein IJP58_06025, partial [Clostridia bacterium]|nr:hypothetical protein [Clostridia bacterium]
VHEGELVDLAVKLDLIQKAGSWFSMGEHRIGQGRDAAKRYLQENPEIAAACKALEDEFAGEGRVLIRPSGTEPLVRVMIEGKDVDYITKKAEELANMIEKILG